MIILLCGRRISLLKANNKEIIHKIKAFLDDNIYNVLYKEVGGGLNYFYNPFPKSEVIKSNLIKYDIKIQLLFKLLLLGEYSNYLLLCDMFGYEIIENLLKVGYLIKKGENIYSDGYSIIAYFDYYFIVATPHYYKNHGHNQEIYIGMDSYRMTSILPHKSTYNNFLDLCTGSGIQGILLSEHRNRGYVVEMNPKVIETTRFNVILNELEDKVSPILGDLYSQIPEQEFDVIVSNPPFIPVPREFDFPLAGGGGEDGLQIINEILVGYNSYLKMGGLGIICGESIGNHCEPLIINTVKKILPQNYKVDIILHSKIDVSTLANNMTSICREVENINDKLKYYETWIKFYKKLECTHYYVFSLFVKKKNDNQPTVINVIEVNSETGLNHILSVPKFKLSTDKVYKIIFENEKSLIVDDDIMAFLELIDGVHDISELLEMFFYEKKNLDNNDAIIQKILKIVTDLVTNNNIILKS